eukprot:984048-Heterocapsa_arctica.AAC.1
MPEDRSETVKNRDKDLQSHGPLNSTFDLSGVTRLEAAHHLGLDGIHGAEVAPERLHGIWHAVCSM